MDDLKIGKKVHHFRSEKGITIRELSQETRITPSMLSQIERDLVNPSINTLKAISKALDIPLYRFFKDDDAAKDLVVRSNTRKKVGWSERYDVVLELLTPDNSGNIEFSMMYLPLSASSEIIPQSHDGEEVAYVLEGKVDIVVEKREFTLEAGDSIRIPPLSKHKWINRESDMVKVILASIINVH